MTQSAPVAAPYAAALLAGGQSRRMGRDKAWLDWQGVPLWQVQLGKLASLNPPPRRLQLSCRVEQEIPPQSAEPVYDPPGKASEGPLPAILRCLEAAQMPLLVLGVDMPGMTPAFLEAIVQRALASPDSRGVVYEGPRGFEPLAAFYPVAVLPLLQAAVAAGNFRLQAFIRSAVAAGQLEVLPVSGEAMSCFSNLNTPEDVSFQGEE